MPREARPTTARLIARWTIVLVGLGVAWRLAPYALSFPIWGDEAFVAVSILTRDFPGMLAPLEHFQIVPVGFMWIELAAARVFGDGPGALRLAPVLAGVASIVVFWRLSGRLLDRRSAFLALAIFAASYYPARHSTEIKPYSLDLLAALVITWAAWAVWSRPRRPARWAVLAGVGAIGVWCSYPSVFVAGGALAALGVVVRRARSPAVVAAWLASGLVLAASFAAMYVIVAKGQAEAGASLYAEGSSWPDAFPPAREPWRLPWWLFATHAGNMLAYPVGGKNFGSSATFLLVVFGVVALWRGRRPVAFLLLAPFALTLVAAMLERYPYGGSARVAQHLAPMICLFAGAGLVAVARRLGGAAAVRGTVVVTPWIMAAIIAAGLVGDARKPYKNPEDVTGRDAMIRLRDASGSNDAWVVSGGFDDDAVGPDMRRWGGRAARLRYHVLRYAPASVAWSPPVETLPTTGVVWLIVYHQFGTTRENDTDDLNDYVGRVRAALGEPEVTRCEIDPDADEWIEFHRFERVPSAPAANR